MKGKIKTFFWWVMVVDEMAFRFLEREKKSLLYDVKMLCTF